jgi:5-methylcytosine-specific restriction endonuclease McrA
VPRKVEEWIEYDHDKPIPTEVRRRIVKRGDGKCVVCGRLFDEKLKPQFDHRPPLWELNGPQRESGIFATCMVCHKGLTKKDSGKRAAIKKSEKKAWGLNTPKSRGFSRAPKKRSKPGTWESFTCPHTGILKARWVSPSDADDN